MSTKLLDLLKAAKINNQWVKLKASPPPKAIYSITQPFMEPEKQVETFFSKPPPVRWNSKDRDDPILENQTFWEQIK